MQMGAFARAISLLPLLLPFAAYGQFQQPTDEELKMTADPKAPGAAAVILNLEEVTDDPLHYHSYYERIKVLEEKGKELATIELPYWHGEFKITDIKGRTIHPDGTVVPLDVKPEDLMVTKAGQAQLNKRVFTLPSVEVGSILEYRYELRYDDNHYSSPEWEVQRPYFVHKAHYAFTPFKAFQKGAQAATSQYLIDSHGNAVNTLIWWRLLPTGTDLVQDQTGHFSLDLTDIPPAPNEEWMPPTSSLLYHVQFYYMSATSTADFWQGEAKRWAKEVDHFAEPTKPIREAVAGLVAPTDSELDKAKKLYKAVQALDNTDYSRKKGTTELKVLKLHEAKRAEDTWAQKSGSSEDIALLYLAMLRAAGLTAYDMKVVDRERGMFDPSFMNFGQLDDDLIILRTGGKDILLDPGEKMCPFETVSWRHSGAGGVMESAQGRAAGESAMQSYAANTTQRLGDITVDEQGGITGTVRYLMMGQEALRWRQAALENDIDEVKKGFNRWIGDSLPQGIEGDVDHFLALDDPDVNLMAIVKVKGTLGTATSKRLLLPGFFFETRPHPFVNEEKRLAPVDMHYGDEISDEMTYHLPPGMTVEGAPQDEKIPWAGHAVLVSKTNTSTAGEVTVTRQLARAFTFAKPQEYQNLHDFYQKVAAADQQQLVLARAPAVAKGN
jgi:Domain of Unknown Function with PDB structure (DUF3857)/Transglutaminase-like superfamily